MNSVVLVGNLARDPELRETSSGIACCNFTVAVQRNYKDANGETTADFISVVTWRAQAENCGKYLKKGSKVAVNGSLQTRTYEAADGSKRYITEVVANNVEFLSPKGQTSNGSYDESVPEDLEPIDDEESLPF